MTEVKELCDTLRVDLRAAISDIDATIDLPAALDSLAMQSSNLNVVVRVDGIPPMQPLASWTVFRCVQEAITNASKHGRASEVVVEAVPRDPGEWRIRIANDGASPSTPIRAGNGLNGMRARMNEIDGNLEFEPGPRFAVLLSGNH